MIKKISIFLILAALLFFYFLPSGPSSSVLETSTKTLENGDTVITEIYFIDSNGRITVASDKGYAILRTTKNSEGKTILEEYLGADGEPVTLSAGYSAIRRLYTDRLNTTITYLDTVGQPVVIGNGYDTIRRTYNDQRLADTDTYWIGETRVIRKQGYAELRMIYGTGADAKRIVRQEYRGLDGSLVLNSSGYAVLTRKYNSNGKIETELYFGTDYETVAIDSGYYGFKRIYDEEGRITSTTYLDAGQIPINTNRGYATIKYIYGGEGVKYLYFDDTGVATTGAHGEYGYATTADGKKIYLDSDGEPLRRLDIFLHNSNFAVLILGAVFTLLAMIVPGKARIAFLFVYLAFIGLMTLAWREGIDNVKGELFWSYKQFMRNSGLRREIINNMFLFIPLGVIITRLIGNRRFCLAALICLAVSAAVELIQLKQNLGTFEFDDMISNGIGGMIGMMIAIQTIQARILTERFFHGN